MEQVLNSRQMRALDEDTIRTIGIPSLVLMERAALRVCEEVRSGYYRTDRILVLAGSGNNGGDGVAAARILTQAGCRVEVMLVLPDAAYSDDLSTQIGIATRCKVEFTKQPDFSAYTLILDAVFGVGLGRDVTGRTAELFERINRMDVPVIAVDMPSGLDSDTGRVRQAALMADTTLTLSHLKPGLFLGEGIRYAGRVVCRDIGVCGSPESDTFAVQPQDLEPLFKRDETGNKGTFGKVLAVTGSARMGGAAFLSAAAILTGGAGMVRIVTHTKNRDFLLGRLPEAMISDYRDEIDIEELTRDLAWADVVLIGPGLSLGACARTLFDTVMRRCEKPCVIDADGLTLLKGYLAEGRKLRCPAVLTPHMGECARLLGMPLAGIRLDRADILRRFASKVSAVCVCKDACTFTAYPDGQGYINTSGNSALATAGSGDVLAGMIAGYLAASSGHADMSVVPKVVYLHGLLGELAAKKTSKAAVTASRLLAELAVFPSRSGVSAGERTCAIRLDETPVK